MATTRASVDDVKAILEDSHKSATDITVFLNIAHGMVDDNCLDESYSDNQLKEIERWLAAHLLCVRNRRVTSDNMGDHSMSYEGQTGMYGLEATSYGLQIGLFDTHGVLRAVIDKKGVANFKVMP